MKFFTLIVWVFILLGASGEVSAPITAENAHQIVEIASWTGEPRLISDLGFSPNDNYLAIIGGRGFIDNGEVTFLSSELLEKVSLTSETLIATRLAFSPDGTLFVIGNESGQITVFQFEPFEPIMTVQGANGRILSVAIDPMNRFVAATFGSIATGMEGDTIFQVFAISSGSVQLSLPCINITQFGCDGPFGSAATFDATGDRVFLATSDGTVRSWNLETMQQSVISDNYSRLPHDFTYSGDQLGYITFEGAVRLLHSDGSYDDLIISPLNETDPEFPYAVASHPREPILAVAYGRNVQDDSNRDAVLRLWNVDSRDVLATIEMSTPQDDPIFNLTFNSDGTLLATGSGDGTVRLWGVPSN